MFIPYYLIIIFIGFFILFGFYIIYLYYLYNREREFESYKKQLDHRSSDILSKATNKAQDLIIKATEKAKDIIMTSEYLKSEIKEDLEEQKKQILKEYSDEIRHLHLTLGKSFEQIGAEIKQGFLDQAKKSIVKVESSFDQELEDFKQVIKNQTVLSQNHIGQRISSEFEKAEEEIQIYKKNELDKINFKIGMIIQKVTEEALKDSLTIELNEKFLLETLEKARRESFLKE